MVSFQGMEQDPDKPSIEYPCTWTYALIGSDEEDLRLSIGEILKGRPHKVDFSKLSAGKKYVSVHVHIEVVSQADRDDLFESFRTHPSVKYIL